MKIEEAIVYLLATSGHGMKKVRRDNAPVMELSNLLYFAGKYKKKQ